MEWTNNLVLALIQEYRDHSVLWDSTLPHFKIKNRRDQAWEEIADKLGSNVNEVKKKINSLLASFRRERSRVLKSEIEFQEPYQSRWFAFESFQFLMDKPATKPFCEDFIEPIFESTYNVQEFDCATIIKSEVEDSTEDLDIRYPVLPEETLISQEQPGMIQAANEKDEDFKKKRVLAKRKYQYDDSRVSNLCKIVGKLNNDYERRDECKVFGEYLVFKMRNYDFRTRSIVQHLINTVVFNADMGKYTKNETSKSDNENKTLDDVTLLPGDKTISQEIDYLQGISDIASNGKHFLDV